MPWWSWSRTANTNATADPTINMAEGMAPSAVNDGVRALMAASAMYRDDISGAIVTSGSSTAYTVASYSTYDTLAHMDKALIAFTPHTANGATVTLNVDGLGAKALRASTGVELQSSVLIAGTPYMATYNNSDAAWYVHGIGGNNYGIPLAAGMDYWAATAPSSAFAFPLGQAISRTTYASLFALIGTTYGAGNGSTTFNLPNKGERVSIMKVSAASLMTATYFGGDSTALGATGGGESKTLGLTDLPGGITASNPSQAISVNSNVVVVTSGFAGGRPSGSGPQAVIDSVTTATVSSNAANSINVNINNTGSAGTGSGAANPIRTVQPTIVCNYIMRVI